MIQLYHNSRCGKSREAFQILQASGKAFTTVNYLQEPPTKTALENIIQKLGIPPMGLIRQTETLWKEQFKNKEMNDNAIIDAMINHPILIQRPIVINGNKAIIGRPPSQILTII